MNEHICILKKIDKLKMIGTRIRTTKSGKSFRIAFGLTKRGKNSVEQSYNYSVDKWTAKEARIHCNSHGGFFIAAFVKQATNNLREYFKKINTKGVK